MASSNMDSAATEPGKAPWRDNAKGAFSEKGEPIFEPKRKLKVICVGAGASGLLIAYKMQRHFDDFDLTVYEKNEDLSGTWFENRYPGCACDIPAHSYVWSFEPKTDWSALYASSTEIHSYFKDFSHKYGLERFIKFKQQVSGATWNPTTAMWEIEITDIRTGRVSKNTANVFINAGGILNAWKYPPIPGLKDFQGSLLHSAAWDPNVSLSGKTVGLIGNGSSGIQILPAIKKEVKHLVTFLREPTWVAPPMGQAYKLYSREEKAQFATDSEYHLEYRREIESGMNGSFSLFRSGSEVQNMTKEYMLGLMTERLANPELEKLLIPEWPVGCRRLTPGTNYLESLSDDNVQVVYGEIQKIDRTGLWVDDGKHYPVDVLICATGFDTSFKPRFSLVGSNKKLLSEVWKDEPMAYFGIAAPEYPNYFMTLGPNCPIGNGPVLPAIEAEVEYIIKVLSKFQKENIKSFDVRPEPVVELNAWKDKFMENTIWTQPCRSWYKNGSTNGHVAALWPGSTLHYLEAMESPRWEDWKFEYAAGNRFAYLGNGSSSAETREGGSLNHYVRSHDDSPVDIVLKNPKPEVKSRPQGILYPKEELEAVTGGPQAKL